MVTDETHGKTPVKVTGFCFKLCGTKGLVFVVGKNLCSSQYIQCSLSPLQKQRFSRAAGKAMGAMMRRATRHHSYQKGQRILILCHTYSYLGLVAAEGDPLGSLLQQLPCMTGFCTPSFARLTWAEGCHTFVLPCNKPRIIQQIIEGGV